MTRQMTFDLPSVTALGREDFFVSPSNAAAVDAIQSWHDWPMSKLILVGPEGSGKTHLAHIWAGLAGAGRVQATEIAGQVDALSGRALVIEDAEQIAGQREAEEALFHLHNLLLEDQCSMLITASAPPSRWALTLPDLQSRMQGSALVSLAAPDDILIKALLVKLFRDRQLDVDPDVLDYLFLRMERSFTGVGHLVAALDKEALAQGRPITKRLAGYVLDKVLPDTS